MGDLKVEVFHGADPPELTPLDLWRSDWRGKFEEFLEDQHTTLWGHFDVSDRKGRRAAACWMDEKLQEFSDWTHERNWG